MLKSRNENFAFLKMRTINSHLFVSDAVVLLAMIGDLPLTILRWLLVAFFGGQVLIFVGLMVWTIWNDAIRPRLVPADDIARAADDIIASYPDPELEAFTRHERAWYDSDGAEQTYWHRVRKAIRQRLEER